ncbi:MAG TPA: deoxyribodipyrimidine photo-lyase [Thiohalobacter sp.]|nr:deoxyribodipyrimidine photo-lyase [Thiohalobacter sp.]
MPASPSTDTAILWFRQDLRLADNPALRAACRHADRLIPVYILETDADPWAPGAANRWWLHHSLAALGAALRERGSRLHLMQGAAGACLQQLVEASGATAVYWNRRFEPAAIRRDRDIKGGLKQQGIVCHSFNAALLIEPWDHLNQQGRPYRVFTPFWRSLQSRLDSLAPQRAPSPLPGLPRQRGRSLQLDALGLLPGHDWDAGLHDEWKPGETGAHNRLRTLLERRLQRYPEARDRPDADGTSRLSPHLHFGELGPRQVVARIQQHTGVRRSPGLVGAGEQYLRQLAWREFAHHLLYHFPETPERPLDSRFEAFPWRVDPASLRAWQRGRTGIPLVDAGMRELWHTGWMHNRVRMVAASFLTKNLGIHWREGARWFWDTLVDADLANNTLGWQWTAGCGADAAPFFRIFNPVAQAQKFNPDGSYLRRWLPELAALPDKWLARPWEAPAAVLAEAGVELDATYPRPLVDLKASRQRALAGWGAIRSQDRATM